MEDSGARAAAVQKLMAAKGKSGKSFSDIGAHQRVRRAAQARHGGRALSGHPGAHRGARGAHDAAALPLVQPGNGPRACKYTACQLYDLYCTVDKAKGVDGKDRAVITFDGKYLPHTEQKSANMMSKLACKAP